MPTAARTRVIALDVGDARTGVAVSDELGLTAQPLVSICKRGKKAVGEVLSLLDQYRPGIIILGLPLELSGEKGEQAQKVEAFAALLERRLRSNVHYQEIELVFYDERLTTKEAAKVIAGSKLKDEKRSAALDRVAAALILDGFLQKRNRQV